MISVPIGPFLGSNCGLVEGIRYGVRPLIVVGASLPPYQGITGAGGGIVDELPYLWVSRPKSHEADISSSLDSRGSMWALARSLS